MPFPRSRSELSGPPEAQGCQGGWSWLQSDFPRLLPARAQDQPPEAKISKVRCALGLCLTLCNPMDYRVHGILQARVLE